MAPLIRLTDLCKSFGIVKAVDTVSLDIEAGEIFCLLGSSGCGKTTLLRMLAGFEEPTSGKIEIDGIDMAGVDPSDRPVNIMFQNYALFPHMSVASNIGYGLRRAGMRGAELQSRVEGLLQLVHLEGYEKRKPDQLSGGQRQRVALARSLARRPKLLLLDEPLAALDKKLREDTQFELMNIQDELGTAFMVVTHDQEEAMVLADRIGVMYAGELIQVDAPRKLYERPHNRFVADFLGSISFIEAEIQNAGDQMLCTTSEGRFTVKPDQTGDFSKGQKLTLAARPEKITLQRAPRKKASNGGAGATNEMPVTVEDFAYVGAVTHYRVRTKAGTRLNILQTNGASDDAPLSWDEQGYAYIDPSDFIVLTD